MRRGRALCGIVAALLATSVACLGGGARSHRFVIYLHGRIVQEEQSARPTHPRFGTYELAEILATFRDRGFAVSGDIRPKAATVGDAADRVVQQVRGLIEVGLSPDHVTVVGASMGAAIALRAAARLQNPEVRFAVLGACLSESVRGILAEEGKAPAGHILSIREASDESTRDCPPWTGDLAPAAQLDAKELVVSTGLSHGFLYRPLPEWVVPVAEWANGATQPSATQPSATQLSATGPAAAGRTAEARSRPQPPQGG